MKRGAVVTFCIGLGVLVGCEDAGPLDAGAQDASAQDAQAVDAAPDASEEPDAGVPDADPLDATESDAGLGPDEYWVEVTLDGTPVAGATVIQGGGTMTWLTDETGHVVVRVDRSIIGEQVLLGSHPESRISGELIPDATQRLTIPLLRFDASDNPDYVISDPGEPERRGSTGQCGHCHQTFNDEWFASPHRSSAKNPTVQDLYAGAATAFATEVDCLAAGGRWQDGPAPGGGRAARCYLGAGVQPSLNPSCAQAPCEGTLSERGQCADCHAPGINGVIGGRDLLEAEGVPYDYGVHCDVCHRVVAVNEDDPRPGVSGRLSLMRPSEPGSPGLGAGGRLPLTFGPSYDSPNPRMGGAQRDHFRQARFCAGCHQLDSPVLLPGASLDPNRWPQGRLPVQSTFEEWRSGALADAAPCQSCHMPPAAERINGADLQRYPDSDVGYQGGWYRAPGSVRQHSWIGPRQPESRMLQLAAALFVQKNVAADALEVQVTVKNVSAGHAIPTGEPMRHLVLRVEAWCGTAPLAPRGGDVVPDFGGARQLRRAGEDLSRWPGARVGDRLRVVNQPGAFLDYPGFGPFGDGTFTPAQKGMPVQTFVGEVGITQVAPDGAVTLDGPLPAGAVTYLVRGPEDHAGAPGFGFARVLVGPDGRRMVPHFLANDVASDNRLMPQARFTSQHTFHAPCADPVVQARLLYRAYTPSLAEERGWSNPSTVMAEVRR